MQDWERAHGLPEKALRTLARNEKSALNSVFSGKTLPHAAAQGLINEMISAGMEVGKLNGKGDELGQQLVGLLQTVRVNGDGKAAPRPNSGTQTTTSLDCTPCWFEAVRVLTRVEGLLPCFGCSADPLLRHNSA